MEGRAVPTSVADQTAVINQIVLSRKIMREVLIFGGWVKPPPARQPDPREEEERLLERALRNHIKIEVTRDEMVRVSFSDNDPQRTYQVANKLADGLPARERRRQRAGEPQRGLRLHRQAGQRVRRPSSPTSTRRCSRSIAAATAPKPRAASSGAAEHGDRRCAAEAKISADELAALRTTRRRSCRCRCRARRPAAQPIDMRAEEQARSPRAAAARRGSIS